MRAPIVVGVAAVLVVLLISSVASSGQLEKGTHEIMGRFNFSRTSYSAEGSSESIARTEIVLAPGYGYFITDQWEIVFGVPISFASWSDGDDSVSATLYGAELGVLYHFGSEGNTIPYLGGGAGIAGISAALRPIFSSSFRGSSVTSAIS